MGGSRRGPHGAAAASSTGAASAGQRRRINSWVTRGAEPPRGQRWHIHLQHFPKASLLPLPPPLLFFFFSPPDINAMAQPSPPPSACPSGCHETWLGANKPPTYSSIYIAIVFLNGCLKGKQNPGDCVPRGQHKLAADRGGRNHL